MYLLEDNKRCLNSLPNDFLKQYENFENWHFEKEKYLNNNNENSFINLKAKFSVWKMEFMEEIEKIGITTYNYSIKEQQIIKNYIKESRLFKKYIETPYYKQIIEKPRGYAGDSKMMEIIYRNEFEGNSIFLKMIHKLATECDACVSVRNRRNLLTKEIMKSKGSILSLAAGPTAEIFDTLGKRKNNNDRKFLALDHDIETLKSVKKRDFNGDINYGIINVFNLIKGKRKVLIPKIKFLDYCNPKKDTKGMSKVFLPLKYKIFKLKPNSYDLIYTAGLYDYIETFSNKDKGTIALTEVLFDLLKPGGNLIIGNFSDKNPIGIRWVMEFICDWNLIYRSENEMLKFIERIPEEKIDKIQIIKESNQINYFLKVIKK